MKQTPLAKNQLVAIVMLPLLTLTMIPVYRLLARLLGKKKAWYAGFLVYWLVWCIFFPLRLLGFKKLRVLFQCRRPTALGWFMLIFPPFMALLGRIGPNKKPRKRKERLVLVGMAFMNGILEEVLWRGVYVALFPKSLFWGTVWPSIWFALWHFAPGSVSVLTEVRSLMIGAGVLGVFLSGLTRQTRSICWAAASHTVSGLVQALA